jgi:hypothetical protein
MEPNERFSGWNAFEQNAAKTPNKVLLEPNNAKSVLIGPKDKIKGQRL